MQDPVSLFYNSLDSVEMWVDEIPGIKVLIQTVGKGHIHVNILRPKHTVVVRSKVDDRDQG